jgi:hypothetical protein
MINSKVERGDTLVLKSGVNVVVQSTKYEGDTLIRFDYVNNAEDSPMRRTAWPSDIMTLLRKAPKVQMPADSNVKKEMPLAAVEAPEHPALKTLATPVKTETATETATKKHLVKQGKGK